MNEHQLALRAVLAASALRALLAASIALRALLAAFIALRAVLAASMDASECLRRGAVGALGAAPGTLAAHPFDLLKMNQQVRAATLSEAIRHVSAGKHGP